MPSAPRRRSTRATSCSTDRTSTPPCRGVLRPGTPLLTLLAPAALTGIYQVGTAQFGPPLASPGVTGSIVAALDAADAAGPLTTDACSPITNAADVVSRIAIVDRGTCGFTVKVKNAQNASAIGVLIANNVAGGPPGGMAGVDATITIPSVLITQADANRHQAADCEFDRGVGHDRGQPRHPRRARTRPQLHAALHAGIRSRRDRRSRTGTRSPPESADGAGDQRRPDAFGEAAAAISRCRCCATSAGSRISIWTDWPTTLDACSASIRRRRSSWPGSTAASPTRCSHPGCTISDLIAEIQRNAQRDNDFIHGVKDLAQALRKAGIITERSGTRCITSRRTRRRFCSRATRGRAGRATRACSDGDLGACGVLGSSRVAGRLTSCGSVQGHERHRL